MIMKWSLALIALIRPNELINKLTKLLWMLLVFILFLETFSFHCDLIILDGKPILNTPALSEETPFQVWRDCSCVMMPLR
jgi:hypothetical protein